MSQVYVIGRVVTDINLQISDKNVPYVRFDIVETIGYGVNAYNQFLQVWAYSDQAKRLIKRKVKKDSLIFVSGALILEVYENKYHKTKDKRLKVILSTWDFVNTGITNASEVLSNDTNILLDEIDGDREPLPE